MSEWIEKSLGEVTSYIAKGIPPKYIEKLTENAIYVLNQKCNRDFAISYESARIHDLTKKRVADEKMLNEGDVLVNSTGEGTAGRIAQLWDIPYPTTTDGHMITLRPTEEVDPLYYGYAIKAQQALIESLAEGSTGQTEINRKRLQEEVIIAFPKDKDKQNCTAKILDNIDKKITINNEINRNLLEQALAIYHKMFVETENEKRSTCRTDEFFDITIGKTPPRKESEWFSENPSDCVWISISDMGSCGTFVTDSSEYLTREAVDNHNVKVVPDNTVILSFKLTVGRVAITVGETTTNEAIAHFNTSKDNIVEYLYCYLKLFDFGSLGSTSSIGTAVNSKTIKAMDFVVPGEEELQEFCGIVRPMFEQIKKNQFANQNLVTMRDSLLPKLMSGELDISNVDI